MAYESRIGALGQGTRPRLATRASPGPGVGREDEVEGDEVLFSISELMILGRIAFSTRESPL